MKQGDKIIVVSGPRRGCIGHVIEVNGECAGQPCVHVVLHGKKCDSITFFPMGRLAKLA